MGKAIKKAQEIAANTEGVETTTQTKKEAAEGTQSLTLAASAGVTTEEALEGVVFADKIIQQDAEPEPPAVTLDELESMDMDAFGQDDAEEAPRPVWRITDDGCADWAVRKIAEERAELARIKELADAQIQRIEEKVAAAERRCENGSRFLTSKLAEYFQSVPHKVTKTKHSYRLLSGSLSLKLGQPTMKPDNEKLVEYLKAAGLTDLIKTEEKPAWGDFKKQLQIVGASAVDKDTGEIVEGVTIETKPDTFTVDV